MTPRKTNVHLAMTARNLKQLQGQVRTARRELHTLQARALAVRSQPSQGPAALALADPSPLVQSAINAQASAFAAITRLDQLAISMQRDTLTKTANRALLLERLQNAICQSQQCGSRTALVFLDVDHFKNINDTLGHATGDAVLQIVARRLQTAVRDSDAVGRHGGDEFLVLLAEVSKVADVALIAKKIIADIAAPSLACGHMLQVSVSAGIAMFPDDAPDAQSLIGLADAAMYRSKRQGGGRYTFHADPLAAGEQEQSRA
jgi:diguanylate cyclase (GGDEF)-like protein